MDIPVNAQVECTDGLCGRSTYVVFNPITDRLTHVVVREIEFPHNERLVPIEEVKETTSDLILLRCTREELASIGDFIEREYLHITDPLGDYEPEEIMILPYAMPAGEYISPENLLVQVTHKRVPPHELAVHRGARVMATDGHVGQVDEFLVDPASEQITHLVLREGHLWGKVDVTIPIAEIGHIEENTVHLKLDKEAIRALPTVPVRRRLR